MRRCLPYALFSLAVCGVQALTLDPDYTDIVIPPNIAPLNFDVLDTTGGACAVTLTAPDGESLVARGPQVRWDMKSWRGFLARHAGTTCTISAEGCGSSVWNVSRDAMDPYLTYRLIPPGYTGFDVVGIWQRDLTSFEERPIYRNIQHSRTQCVNCHTYRNADPGTYLFHTRLDGEGTVIRSPKYGLKRIDLKFPGAFAQGTYPAWHPDGELICFSENHTFQVFYETDLAKVEVADLRSDLFLYSLADNRVTVIEDTAEIFECYPAWSPSGTELYSVRARTPYTEKPENRFDGSVKNFSSLTNLFYDIVRRPFDPAIRKFGPPEMLFDGLKTRRSATFPRVSPDGRWLIFTLGESGVFHVWHREADLWICDLRSGRARPISEINSSDADSYHGFTHDGHWMVFSSRRDDGSYTRPYFTHFDAVTGRFSKPFRIPLTSPAAHLRRMASYNVPEFSTGPVQETPRALRRVVESPPVKAVR